MDAAKALVVCELSTSSRLFYRVMAPLFAGTSLFCAIAYLSIDLFKDKDVPPWMEGFPFRAGLAALLLGFAWWLASRISKVNASIRLEGQELRIEGFWSRRVWVHPLSDVASIAEGGIRFKDGRREALEGRAGPGLAVLLSIVQGRPGGP